MSCKWHIFKAYNQQTFYGFGTKDEAEKYADYLNKGKDINLYYADPASPEDAERLDADNGWGDQVNLSDAIQAVYDTPGAAAEMRW